MEKKKLLLITESFPFGMFERSFILEEFKVLAQAYQVTVLARNVDDPLTQNVPDDVKLERFAFCRFAPLLLARQLFRKDVWQDIGEAWNCAGSLKTKLIRTLKIIRYSERAAEFEKRIEQLYACEKFNIGYTYWCNQATVACLRLKKKEPAIKVVTRFLGCDLYAERRSDGWQPFRSMIASEADRLVFVCNYGKEYFLKHWLATDQKKCWMHYLGARAMKQTGLPLDRKPIVLVSCSSMIRLKRVDWIVRALRLLPENVSVEWHHIGDGAERSKVEREIEELMRQHSNVHCRLWGYIPNDQLETVYQEIQPDLFVSMSSTEGGAPVSVAEAFAMGIPAILTAVGGMTEMIVPGRNGWLLSDARTMEEFADAVLCYHQLSAQERLEMHANALETWRTCYDAGENARKYVKALAELID